MDTYYHKTLQLFLVILIIVIGYFVTYKYYKVNIEDFIDLSNDIKEEFDTYFEPLFPFGSWIKQYGELETSLLKRIQELVEENNSKLDESLATDLDNIVQLRVLLRINNLQLFEQARSSKPQDGFTLIPNTYIINSNAFSKRSKNQNTCDIHVKLNTNRYIYKGNTFLKPNKKSNIAKDTCHFVLDPNGDKSQILTDLIVLLDTIGEYNETPELKKILELQNNILNAINEHKLHKNENIPRVKNEIDNTQQSSQKLKNVYEERKKLITRGSHFNYPTDNEQKYNKLKTYDKEYLLKIELYDNSFFNREKKGRKFVLPVGHHVFNRPAPISSIKFRKPDESVLEEYRSQFNGEPWVYAILYGANNRVMVIRNDTPKLPKGFNDDIRAIHVIQKKIITYPQNNGIVSKFNGNRTQVIDVQGGKNNNMTRIRGDEWHGGNYQRWTYDTNNKTLKSTASGKCLDIKYANSSNRTPIIQYNCHNGTNQQWEFRSDGTIRTMMNTNKCITMGTKNHKVWRYSKGKRKQLNMGPDIYINDCQTTNNNNQKWFFIE
jgi:hypothetical protein